MKKIFRTDEWIEKQNDSFLYIGKKDRNFGARSGFAPGRIITIFGKLRGEPKVSATIMSERTLPDGTQVYIKPTLKKLINVPDFEN
jgi:hypothetical protein